MARKLQIRISLYNHRAIGRLIPNQLPIHQPTDGTRFLHFKGLIQATATERMATFFQGSLLHYVPHADRASITVLGFTVGSHAGVHIFPLGSLVEHDARLLVNRLL